MRALAAVLFGVASACGKPGHPVHAPSDNEFGIPADCFCTDPGRPGYRYYPGCDCVETPGGLCHAGEPECSRESDGGCEWVYVEAL